MLYNHFVSTVFEFFLPIHCPNFTSSRCNDIYSELLHVLLMVIA